MPDDVANPIFYDHLEVIREPDFEPERRTRSFTPPKPPEPGSRTEHGQKVSTETSQTLEQIKTVRQQQGIDPNRLIVLKFNSINVDLREDLERFGAWVVDERKLKISDEENHYNILVQFPNEQTLKTFEKDINLYQNESTEKQILPLGKRQKFFDGLQKVSTLSRTDRIGSRLRDKGFPPNKTFYIDVDIWHPGDGSEARKILQDIRSLCSKHGGQLTDEVRTDSLLLTKIHGPKELCNVLLDLDIIAKVDLPPTLQQSYSRIFSPITPINNRALPNAEDPMVCVVDSGVIAGHPLLMNWIIEERDFDTGEDTPVDMNGHGTSVAGLVVYGDIARCMEQNEWTPRVRICSAKILRHAPNPIDPSNGNVIFPEKHRVEKKTEEVIRYFAQERDCRIFNLSLGDSTQIYSGERQFPWAEKLDELARELDIVLVISAGNYCNPPVPANVSTKDQLQNAIREQLLSEEYRVCNPATAALAITVGSIARSDAIEHHLNTGGVKVPDAVAGSPSGAPSPFTRTGGGYSISQTKSTIKPDVVHYGGNYAIQTLAGQQPRWVQNHIFLGEPTIQKEQGGRHVGTMVGTSFACPHVSHIAALAEQSLKRALGRQSSANLIRALIGSSIEPPPCNPEWLVDEKTSLRLVGYGMCSESDVVYSKSNRVQLVAMDKLEENKLHVYRLPIPKAFLQNRGKRGIKIALAFDPPVRSSRKEYLARTMWFEALQGLSIDEVQLHKTRYTGNDPPRIPSWADLKLRPPKTKTQWSTLQVRTKEWKQKPRPRIPDGEAEPIIYILVGCQQRFPTGLDPRQKYGISVLLWHEGENIELYQNLRTRLRLRTRVRVEQTLR